MMKRYAVLAGMLMVGACLPSAAQYGRYPVVETEFHIKQLPGNPFDVYENDVEVTFKAIRGRRATHRSIPAG